MPYGLPQDLDTEENNRWMENCVNQVMSDGTEKDEAIAICKRRLMDSHVQGSEQAVQETIQIVTDPVEINASLGTRYVPGELCRFENMVLAQAEVNANMDKISDENLATLAETLALMPIDEEHRPNQVVGIFTGARILGSKLLADGILYARRFPKLVDDVLNGRKRPSIEAVADTVLCSVCGGRFTSEKDFCEHIRTRMVPKAYENMRAVGGGIVSRPAGSTMFDLDKVYMVASYRDADDGNSRDGGDQDRAESLSDTEHRLLVLYAIHDFLDGEGDPGLDLIHAAKKKWSQDVEVDEGSLKELGWPSYEKLADAIRSGKVSYATVIRKLVYLANVTKDKDTKDKAIDIARRLKQEFRSGEETRADVRGGQGGQPADNRTIEDILAELDQALGRLKALEAENDALKRELSARIVQARRLMLAGVMSEEEFNKHQNEILKMDDDQVQLLLTVASRQGRASTSVPVVGGTVTVSFGDQDDVDIVTL